MSASGARTIGTTKPYLNKRNFKYRGFRTIPSARRTIICNILTGRSPGLTDIQHHRCGGSVRLKLKHLCVALTSRLSLVFHTINFWLKRAPEQFMEQFCGYLI